MDLLFTPTFFFFFPFKKHLKNSEHYGAKKLTILLELCATNNDHNVKKFGSNFSLSSAALSIAILGMFLTL